MLAVPAVQPLSIFSGILEDKMIIRWVSEDGKRKWLYPIEKDIYSHGKIIKQVSHKAKIIGITKVNIPSPLHPIIPYYVMLLEDEYGNRLPKKTMKSRKIGDVYEIKPATSNGAVIITKIKYDINAYLKESLNLLNSYDLNDDDKILIKPSIIEPAHPYQSVNTNPKILDAIICHLKEKGVKDIIVAEQSMLGNDTIASSKKAGILDVCKKHDVQFVDLSKSNFIEKIHDDFKFNIAKEVLERKIINVPVMKTHTQIGISGAMENMIRVVDEKTQKEMYTHDIEKTLPKLIKTLPGFLSIGDTTIGMHGNGPTYLGEPAFLNMIFVSKDPVALDTVFTEIGIFEMPNYIKIAGIIGAGNNITKDIEIVGDELEASKFHLKIPEKNISAHPNIELIDGKANPYIFNSALKSTAKLVGLLGSKMQLVIGSHFTEDMVKGKNRLVAYGNDAIKKIKDLGLNVVAEIPDDIDDIEKLMLIKSILENPDKTKLDAKDKLFSKIGKIGTKLKQSLN
ncbi:MAG: DUF362 domain-containing protein [Nanoarchaeota archaeon]|nr:DUF362 domain-containing protein [Nanoarchaeota archaeon]